MSPSSFQRNGECGREHRSIDRSQFGGIYQGTSNYRSEGRPPSGRGGSRWDRHALPSNFDSLSPRLTKTRAPPTAAMPAQTPGREWSGSSCTFTNVMGPPPMNPALPYPTYLPQGRLVQPATGLVCRWESDERRRPIGGHLRTFQSDQEEMDSLPGRHRSQDSMSGCLLHHGRERMTSFNDSRISTSSSSVECGSWQHHPRGIKPA